MKLFTKSEDNILQKKGYVVGEVLGKGSYGTVNKATWKKDEKSPPETVAIKMISLKEVPDDFRNKFLKREISISRVLDHPNIIKTIEVIEAKNRVFMPIELATRGDMLEYIQLRGPLPESTAAKFFGELCQGLHYLHKRDVVHRDLKCENILLNSQNHAKIADFGFARKQRGNELSDTYCGSAAYAAPELLRGMPYKGVDADLWSLGVILFTMACAMMPFRDGNIKTLMADQRKPLVYPRNQTETLSDPLKQLMQGLLTHKLRTRYTLEDAMSHPWNALADVPAQPQSNATE